MLFLCLAAVVDVYYCPSVAVPIVFPFVAEFLRNAFYSVLL